MAKHKLSQSRIASLSTGIYSDGDGLFLRVRSGGTEGGQDGAEQTRLRSRMDAGFDGKRPSDVCARVEVAERVKPPELPPARPPTEAAYSFLSSGVCFCCCC